jgi:hypothetical protein
MTTKEEKTVRNQKIQTRPYSSDEIKDMFNELFKKLCLSDVYIHHKQCGHSYYVKSGSIKERNALQSGHCLLEDSKNCSVCWKLDNSIPDKLATPECVNAIVFNTATIKDYKTFETFYTWLYKKNN